MTAEHDGCRPRSGAEAAADARGAAEGARRQASPEDAGRQAHRAKLDAQQAVLQQAESRGR